MFCHKEVISESHMLAETCNPITQDVYTGELPQVQGQFGLSSVLQNPEPKNKSRNMFEEIYMCNLI